MFGEISENRTRAFFSEGVGLLRGKSHEQTVLLLVLHYVFHKILDGFADGDPFNCRLPTQLLCNLTLGLQIRYYHIHHKLLKSSRWFRAWFFTCCALTKTTQFSTLYTHFTTHMSFRSARNIRRLLTQVTKKLWCVYKKFINTVGGNCPVTCENFFYRLEL